MLPYHEIQIEDYDEPELQEILKSDRTKWIEYFGWSMAFVPPKILQKDKFFNWLYKELPYMAGVLKFPKNTCYNWHTDSLRGGCINMALGPQGKSHCLFAPDGTGVTHKFVELKYKPGRRYLFNNQIPHTVINFDQDRYVFTIEFLEDKSKLNYQDLLNLIKSQTDA